MEATDAVERKIKFQQQHPEVTFEVSPGLIHRAEYIDPETGEVASVSAVWLGQIMDHLARKFS